MKQLGETAGKVKAESSPVSTVPGANTIYSQNWILGAFRKKAISTSSVIPSRPPPLSLSCSLSLALAITLSVALSLSIFLAHSVTHSVALSPCLSQSLSG